MESRIIGLLFSGYAVRLAAAALALYIGAEAWDSVSHAFGQVESGLALAGRR